MFIVVSCQSSVDSRQLQEASAVESQLPLIRSPPLELRTDNGSLSKSSIINSPNNVEPICSKQKDSTHATSLCVPRVSHAHGVGVAQQGVGHVRAGFETRHGGEIIELPGFLGDARQPILPGLGRDHTFAA